MKLENLLLDQFFNLKIADFGFAAPIGGKYGTGSCMTYLGTLNYMAPEIHLGNPYNGASVDLFACGIILFIMYAIKILKKGNPRINSKSMEHLFAEVSTMSQLNHLNIL